MKEDQKIIKVKNVSKYFLKNKSFFKRNGEPFAAVDDVSFSVDKGEIYGVIGINGSGKSTLIRILSTLLIPDKGDVFISSYNLKTSASKIREVIARVSVDAAFFKRLTPRENLLFAGRLYGMDSESIIKKSRVILDDLGLSISSFDESMENMSRGMQQKVSIARAFLVSPKVILLDEPTTGLDPKSKLLVLDFIKSKIQEEEMTIILTTHDMKEAENLCTRVAMMQKGKFIIEGTKNEIVKAMNVNSLEDAFIALSDNGKPFNVNDNNEVTYAI